MADLSSIYVEYTDSLKKPFDAKPNRLYVTDVGSCPRHVAYRLVGAEKNPVAESTTIATKMMFDFADYIETRLIDALDHAHRLYSQQGSATIDDHENWGGRYDILAEYGGRRIIEVKTVRSNAFGYPLPKRNHEYQAAIYHHYLEESEHLEAAPILWYADRGGTNPPLEFPVLLEAWEEAEGLMNDLDEMRSKLPELPPQLPKVLVLRSWGKEVKEEPDHRCGYCDYSDVCNIDRKVYRMAYQDKDGNWKASRRANIDDLVRFGIDLIHKET